MISKLLIENFQSHHKTALNFVNGLNVIWGNTDSGKSSIIRALEWIIANRPSGDSFRRHDTKKTAVSARVGKTMVRRRRSGKKNEYQIGKEIYKALRSAVPEEVTSTLNLNKSNIQSQHEVYFLVDKSPGQISKKLNEVAGLEIMDNVMKEVNAEIRQTNADIKNIETNLEETEGEIRSLKWVPSADAALNELEEIEKELSQLQKKQRRIHGILYSIDQCMEMKKYLFPKEMVLEIKKLVKEKSKIENMENDLERKRHIIKKINSMKSKLKNIPDIEDLSGLKQEREQIRAEEARYDYVQIMLSNIRFEEARLGQLKEELELTETKIKDELKRRGVCPTCHRKIR